MFILSTGRNVGIKELMCLLLLYSLSYVIGSYNYIIMDWKSDTDILYLWLPNYQLLQSKLMNKYFQNKLYLPIGYYNNNNN